MASQHNYATLWLQSQWYGHHSSPMYANEHITLIDGYKRLVKVEGSEIDGFDQILLAKRLL
eukprot:COSAG01_NODE_29301_length_640_cov_4.802218_1_plen_60_part_10